MRAAILLFLLLSASGFAQDAQPFVDVIFYSGTNVVGMVRKACTNKTEAVSNLERWTNSITGVGKGLSVVARYHVCGNGLPKQFPCQIVLLAGKKWIGVDWNTARYSATNLAEVALVPAKGDPAQVRYNVPTFRIPCTKATAPALIQRICIEEFAGKQVKTNVVDATAATPQEIPK